MTGEKKPNQYKHAVEWARNSSAPTAARLQDALDAAGKAMAAGAWLSTKATEFGHGLTSHSRTLRTAGERVTDEFNATINTEPDQVDEDDWRARWSRINRGMR